MKTNTKQTTPRLIHQRTPLRPVRTVSPRQPVRVVQPMSLSGKISATGKLPARRVI